MKKLNLILLLMLFLIVSSHHSCYCLTYVQLKQDSLKFLIEKMNQSISNKDYKNSYLIISDMIKLDSVNIDFYFTKATICENLNLKNEAIELYEKTLNMNPYYFNSIYNLGIAYYNIALESKDSLDKKIYFEKSLNHFFKALQTNQKESASSALGQTIVTIIKHIVINFDSTIYVDRINYKSSQTIDKNWVDYVTSFEVQMSDKEIYKQALKSFKNLEYSLISKEKNKFISGYKSQYIVNKIEHSSSGKRVTSYDEERNNFLIWFNSKSDNNTSIYIFVFIDEYTTKGSQTNKEKSYESKVEEEKILSEIKQKINAL